MSHTPTVLGRFPFPLVRTVIVEPLTPAVPVIPSIGMCLAIPGRVLRVDGSIATLDVRGRQVQADASMVSVKPGDFVVVYAGLIVQMLEEDEAQERLRLLAGVNAKADSEA